MWWPCPSRDRGTAGDAPRGHQQIKINSGYSPAPQEKHLPLQSRAGKTPQTHHRVKYNPKPPHKTNRPVYLLEITQVYASPSGSVLAFFLSTPNSDKQVRQTSLCSHPHDSFYITRLPSRAVPEAHALLLSHQGISFSDKKPSLNFFHPVLRGFTNLGSLMPGAKHVKASLRILNLFFPIIKWGLEMFST